jgi:hypothetical protein
MLVLASGCSYKIYVRGVHDRDAGLLEPDTGLHIQVNTTGDDGNSNVVLAAKIQTVLEAKGFRVVPEAEAVAYLFFEYDMEDLVKRKYLHPSPGVSSGLSTHASEGPFVHTLSVSVVNAGSYMAEGKTHADVLWAGGAVLDTTSLRSPKVIDMLVVTLFDHFPDDTQQTLKLGMNLNDSRAKSLRAQPE